MCSLGCPANLQTSPNSRKITQLGIVNRSHSSLISTPSEPVGYHPGIQLTAHSPTLALPVLTICTLAWRDIMVSFNKKAHFLRCRGTWLDIRCQCRPSGTKKDGASLHVLMSSFFLLFFSLEQVWFGTHVLRLKFRMVSNLGPLGPQRRIFLQGKKNGFHRFNISWECSPKPERAC